MKYLALSLLLISIVHADPVHADRGTEPFIPHHRVQFGADTFWSHYRSSFEEGSKGTKLATTIDGYYGGFRASYDYLQPDALYAGTEGIAAWGRDNIKSRQSHSRLSGPSGKTKSKHEHQTRLWANLEQRLGYNAQSTLIPDFIATPYLGLGYHYEGISSDHAWWYYAAGGLKTIQKFYERFEIGIDLKLMYGFDIHDKGLVSITTTQGKKTFWGFETALPLRWTAGPSGRWDVELRPYLLKLNLNSPQTIVGARLLAGYSF